MWYPNLDAYCILEIWHIVGLWYPAFLSKLFDNQPHGFIFFSQFLTEVWISDSCYNESQKEDYDMLYSCPQDWYWGHFLLLFQKELLLGMFTCFKIFLWEFLKLLCARVLHVFSTFHLICQNYKKFGRQFVKFSLSYLIIIYISKKVIC